MGEVKIHSVLLRDRLILRYMSFWLCCCGIDCFSSTFSLLWDDTNSTNCPGRAGFAKARYMNRSPKKMRSKTPSTCKVVGSWLFMLYRDEWATKTPSFTSYYCNGVNDNHIFMLYCKKSNNSYILDVVRSGCIARKQATWQHHCKTQGRNNQTSYMLSIARMTATIFFMSYSKGAKDDSNISNITRCEELQGYDDHTTIKFLICCWSQGWRQCAYFFLSYCKEQQWQMIVDCDKRAWDCAKQQTTIF